MTQPLGLHLSFVRTVPLPERLTVLRDAGFEATALWWEHERAEVRAIRDRAPGLIRQAGLHLDHIHAPYFACNDLWTDDESTRNAAFDLHRGWVDDCGRHEIPHMVMHVTRGRSVPLPHAASLDAFCRLVERAENAGVVIAVENTHAPGHIDVLFETIDSPALGLCYDVAHDRLHSEEPLALLRRWGHRVAVLHISDTDGRRDWHWLPGDGDTDFSEVGACLPRAGYDGALMLESMMGRREKNPGEFARRAYAAARSVRLQLQGRESVTEPPVSAS
jgi:sugar phosphate isomerase/epimerase